jgi:hypothetical protein
VGDAERYLGIVQGGQEHALWPFFLSSQYKANFGFMLEYWRLYETLQETY